MNVDAAAQPQVVKPTVDLHDKAQRDPLPKRHEKAGQQDFAQYLSVAYRQRMGTAAETGK